MTEEDFDYRKRSIENLCAFYSRELIAINNNPSNHRELTQGIKKILRHRGLIRYDHNIRRMVLTPKAKKILGLKT